MSKDYLKLYVRITVLQAATAQMSLLHKLHASVTLENVLIQNHSGALQRLFSFSQCYCMACQLSLCCSHFMQACQL